MNMYAFFKRYYAANGVIGVILGLGLGLQLQKVLDATLGNFLFYGGLAVEVIYLLIVKDDYKRFKEFLKKS